MARQSEQIVLYVSRNKEAKPLNAVLTSFIGSFGGNLPETYALLYAPKRCFLAVVKEAKFYGERGEIDVEKEAVFEARVFNETAELRWLNEANGEGRAVVLSTEEKKILDENIEEKYVDKIDQDYLLWGRSTGKAIGEGTQFAEARIGAFFAPLENVAQDAYAKFTAVEYLGEYEDGNVAVAEERLLSITVL
jgi:CRISPR-associated protein (TIGR03984 family)